MSLKIYGIWLGAVSYYGTKPESSVREGGSLR